MNTRLTSPRALVLALATAGVIGAAHAGWKGTLQGVLEATLDAMDRSPCHFHAWHPLAAEGAVEIGGMDEPIQHLVEDLVIGGVVGYVHK